MIKPIAAALALGLASTPVLAEGFSTSDLGRAGTVEACKERGERMYRAFGVPDRDIYHTPWQVIAFDVGGVDYDSILVCSRDADTRRATLILFSAPEGDDGRRARIRDELKALW